MFAYNLGSRLCQLSWFIDPFCVPLVSKQKKLWLPIYTLSQFSILERAAKLLYIVEICDQGHLLGTLQIIEFNTY